MLGKTNFEGGFRMHHRRLGGLLGAIVFAGSVLTCVGPATAAPISAPSLKWSVPAPAMGESSPNVANLQGAPAVVVGTLGSSVYALRPEGNMVPGWPATLDRPVQSAASMADVDGDGRTDVFVGSGSIHYQGGSKYRLADNAAKSWQYVGRDQANVNNQPLAMWSSTALGDVTGDGVMDASAFTLGLLGWSLNAPNGAIHAGWPFYQDDTTFSSPALADVDRDGKLDYIVGGDSTPGPPVDHRGGMIRAIRGNGTLIWEYRVGEIVRSSPVVGDIDGDGVPEIVVGAGNFYQDSPDQNKVFVLNLNGTKKWEKNLGAQTLASPALADVNGDGTRDVIMPTWSGANAGKLFVMSGQGNYLYGWAGRTVPGGPMMAQPVTADFDNDGAQDILVSTGAGLWAFSGADASQQFTLNEGHGLGSQNTPWIGDFDGNGKLDIIAASTYATNQNAGAIQRWEFANTTARLGANNFSQFRGDARLTGSLDLSVGVSSTPAFVKAAHQDFLRRQPSPNELLAATQALDSGATSKPTFLNGMARSPEWVQVIVTRFYADTLGRQPDPAGLATWTQWISSGQVSVAQAAAGFYSSDEYYQRSGNSDAGWITALYTQILGRTPTASDIAHWSTHARTYGRHAVAEAIYQSPESRNKRVIDLYQALLKRNPDPTGMGFWPGQLLVTGDITLAVNLAESEEYRLRALTRYPR